MYAFFHFRDDGGSGQVGGVERYGRLLSNAARQTGSHVEDVECTVQEGHQYDWLPSAETGKPVACIFQYSPVFPQAGKVEETILSILDRCKSGDAALHRLVVHDGNYLPIPLRMFWKARLFLRPRTLRLALRPDALTLRKCKFLEKAVELGCRPVVFHSAQLDRLPAKAAKCSIVVPHFVENPAFSKDWAQSKKELGFESRTVITILGWINPRKQNELVIAALRFLPETVHLVLAGAEIEAHTGYVNRLRSEAARHGVDARLHITGYLDEERQATYIAATDLAICLFRTVSASGSLSTWIAHTKPILAARLPELEPYEEIAPGSICWSRSLEDRPEAIAADIRNALDAGGRVASKHRLERLRDALRVERVWMDIARFS